MSQQSYNILYVQMKTVMNTDLTDDLFSHVEAAILWLILTMTMLQISLLITSKSYGNRISIAN